MISRRFLVLIAVITTAASFFLLGVFHARAGDAADRAAYDAKLDAIRAEVKSQLGKTRRGDVLPAGTGGNTWDAPLPVPNEATRATMVAEIKQELQNEMGLLPLQLLRDRRTSFVELYTADNAGKSSYGTAGYLGGGYFVTVKHAVVALDDEEGRSGSRRIVSIKVLYQGKEIPATLIDAGDADVEVHSGDWAIIKTQSARSCPRCVPTPRSGTISPNRSSASATTTRRASFSRPGTSGSGRRTAWSRASPTATRACRAAAS